MSLLNPFHSSLPFDILSVQRDAAAARRADKMTHIYHRGQDLIWSGQAVFAELCEKHGGVKLAGEKRAALGAVLSVLMWGELAAWKIAAQLADRLEQMPPKLAATSQAHDEARHFYVLVDYLQALGHTPGPLDRRARLLLESSLQTQDVVKKVMGMQLMIEALALTVFQSLREAQVEPVLTELLRYYEKDEARHVGLGLQFLPDQLQRLSKVRTAELLAFEVQLMLAALLELKALEPHFRVLGVDPRAVFLLGTAKQAVAMEMLWQESGTPQKAHPAFARMLAATGQLLFPEVKQGQGAARRAVSAVQAALRTFRLGFGDDVPASSIDPEAAAVRPGQVW